MHKPNVKAFFDSDTNTITYVVSDPASKQCGIIDSVLDYNDHAATTSTASADLVIDYVRQQGLTVQWLLETHVHADHLSAAPHLQEQLGGTLAIGSHIRTVQDTFANIFNTGSDFKHDGSQFNQLFEDGDTFMLGEIEVHAMHTPGHTPACMTYVIGDAAFIGDTLFMPDYGTARCDFPGGDAGELYQSVQKLFALPDDTRVFLCHDYLPEERSEYQWQTTIAAQKRDNIHIHEGISEEQFVAMRTNRDAGLDMPRLILPSVQINMRAGHMPAAEDNGIQYLKIPVNVLGRR